MFRIFILGMIAASIIAPAHLRAQEGRNAIHPSADQVQPVLPGMQAPSFQVRDVQGNPVDFDPQVMEKPLILTFFRGGWCPYCNLHLAELRHAEKDLKDMGFDIWFVSIDRPELLYESLSDPQIGYTVYSDARLDATRAFGIAFEVDDDTVELYRDHGLDLEAVNGEKHHVLPAPSTFLVGADGVIRFQYTNPDYKVRLSPEILLAAAKAYVQDADARLERELRKMRDQ